MDSPYRGGDIAFRIRSFASIAPRIRAEFGGLPVCGTSQLDSFTTHPLSPRGRRHQLISRPAHYFLDAYRDASFLEIDRAARARLLHQHVGARKRGDRSLCFARSLRVFPFLGSDADPDVLPDRNLGPRTAYLCRRQIHLVHDVGLDSDARGHDLALRTQRLLRFAADPEHACEWPGDSLSAHRTASFRRFFPGLRNQGAAFS